MDFWLRLSGLIDTLNRRVGVCASWLILAKTIISALNAVTRKFPNLSFNAFLEIQWCRIAEASFSNFMAGQRLPFK
jgi:TRAP-type mannitol/chloroaromatic compound transport system permease small subunit